MTAWQWERVQEYANSGVFSVENAGPMLSPIGTFTVSRNDKLELILETLVVGAAINSSTPIEIVSTVRLSTETVKFVGSDGMTCIASGVIPFRISESYNAESVRQTQEKAKVNSLTARLRNDVTPAYTIDWLENLDRGLYAWQGSPVKDHQETFDKRTLGNDPAATELSTRDFTRSKMNFSTLELVVDGIRLYVYNVDLEFSKGCKKPGCIFYLGNPDDVARKKIREVLSFCLGNYLVYLGSTTLCKNSDIVTLTAVSPPSIGRIFETPALPPAPLHNGNVWRVDEQIITRMANALYARYDELRFGSFSWAYWHAMCAPVHMAAVHFGAAIEALQEAYIKMHPGRIQKNLITDPAKWASLKGALLKAIDEAGLDLPMSTIMKNKVASSMNQTPQSFLSEKLLTEIGITLGSVENAAWKRRNLAAHGGEVNLDSVIPTIMETKLLKIILHRLVLKITAASDHYFDDYSGGFLPRKLTDPVPSPSPASGPVK